MNGEGEKRRSLCEWSCVNGVYVNIVVTCKGNLINHFHEPVCTGNWIAIRQGSQESLIMLVTMEDTHFAIASADLFLNTPAWALTLVYASQWEYLIN